MKHIAKNLCISNLFGFHSVVMKNLHSSDYLQHLLFELQIFHLLSCESMSKKVTLAV